ncbi:MAG: cadmium-translocating P-type ATPase [Oscillospiraceae bacterium]|nr:cadmium-translocating P-type ATPase [Oscillospiraceae bacterium]
MQKFKCSDPNCKCCDYLPEADSPVPEEIPESENSIKLVYDVENIDCAACAVNIESAVRKLNGVESAVLSYASGQLHLRISGGTDKKELLRNIKQATNQIAEGVVYRKHETAKKSTPEPDTHTAEIVPLAIGALLFLLGMVIDWTVGNQMLSIIFLMASYLLMGWEVLCTAGKSILKGQMFDENFLMSIATVGAVCIGSWEEAAGVMLFYRIGELFEHIAVERSRKSVMQAIDMRPETVRKIFSRTDIRNIPAEKVRKGDLLLVRAGDRIPVDGIIRKGESTVDTSAMTGESVPVSVREGSEVMSGCINLNGVLELEASAELKDSMITRILDSVENAAAGKPKLDKFITRFSRVYTPVVVAVALLTAIVPSLITGNWSYWVYAALNFLMISCPCALVLSVPLAFFSGIGAGSAKGILFKDGISIEALEKIKAVVMDKTGTLTKGTFTVTEAETTDCNTEALFQMCAACESYSSHPVAKSILAYMQEQGIEYEPAKMVRELAGRGIIGQVNGRQVACGNEKLMEELNVEFVPYSCAGTCIYVSVDNAYYGRLVLSDMPKAHAPETVKTLNQKGIYTVMLTGDSSEHAQKVAEELQIQEVHAGLLPTEKPEYLKQVRQEHGAVMFVGDGINDAPVLSGADVGMAMGSGADAAMEASDVVLLGSDPAHILTALEIAKRVNQTARICIGLALSVKILIMILAFFGFANMWLSVFADTGVTILCVLFVLFRIHFHYRKK